jgi:hypothetical protein
MGLRKYRGNVYLVTDESEHLHPSKFPIFLKFNKPPILGMEG